MSNEELVKLIQQGKNSSDNLGQLFLQNRGLIDKVIRKYSYVYKVNNSKKSIPVIEYQDLMNEAYFGLSDAVQRYEDTAGVKFMSYALFWINQSIQRYIEENGRSIRLPSYMQEKIYQYNKVIHDYNSQLHRNPSDEELCCRLKCDLKLLDNIRKANHNFNQMDSIDREIGDEEGLLLGDTIQSSTDVENEVIDDIMNKSCKTELWKIVKDNVTAEENTVITTRYQKDLSLEATGQLIGSSRDAARNIEARALRKLRRSRIRRELEEKFEVNYARCYRGGLTNFNYTWTSIVEDIAIRNLEAEFSAVR